MAARRPDPALPTGYEVRCPACGQACYAVRHWYTGSLLLVEQEVEAVRDEDGLLLAGDVMVDLVNGWWSVPSPVDVGWESVQGDFLFDHQTARCPVAPQIRAG